MPTQRSRTQGFASLLAALAGLATLALAGWLAPVTPVAAATRPIAAQTSIADLLADADADLLALRLTSPPGANALERYRRVLELDPRNVRAASGLLDIVQRYIALADDAVARGRFDRAGEYLDRAESVLPGNELTAVARTDLERVRRRAARGLQFGTSAAPATGSAPAVSSRPSPTPTPAPAATFESTPAPPAAAAVPSSSPAPAAAPAGPARRLAIFPFETIVPCFMPVGKDLRRGAERIVSERGDAEVAWSYYANGVDERDIPPPERLWSDNKARPVPVAAEVGKAARAVGATTVLMAWYFCSQSERILPGSYEVTVFVVDAESGRVLSETGKLDYGSDVLRKILEQAWNRS